MCTLNTSSYLQKKCDCKIKTHHPNIQNEEVVVSGISGPFLDYLDIYHKNTKNAMGKTTSIRRIVTPKETQNVKDIMNFDSGYFESPYQEELDAQAQFFASEAMKAIIDAGVNPSELERTITGVFLEQHLIQEPTQVSKLEVELIINKMCYSLKLRGPISVTNAYNRSAMGEAFNAIRTGLCDNALVASCNFCFDSATIGELDCGDVFSRLEDTVFIYLQRSKDARRIYGRVVDVNNYCVSQEENEIEVNMNLPKAQPGFGKEFELDCYVDLEKLGMLPSNKETKELISMQTKNYSSQLFKGMLILAKELVLMENNVTGESITSNHRTEEKTVRNDKITNTIIVPTATGEVSLQSNDKLKLNKGIPSDELPRLLCVSGRSKNSITTIFDDLGSGILDVECIGLYHKIFRREVLGHCFRGFSILTKSEEVLRSRKYYGGPKIPLVLIFTDFGNSWSMIANYLYVLPIFAASIKRFYNVLVSKKVNVLEIVLNYRKSRTITSFNRVIGTAAVQIGIADILKILGIVPDYYYGCGVAEIICGYLDGAVGFKETVLSIHHVALMSENIIEKGHGRRHRKTSFDGGKLGKIKPHLLAVLAQTLQEPKRRSDKWLCLNGSKLFTVEDFVNGIDRSYFSSKHLLNYLNKNSILFEIGSGIQNEENFQHHLTFEPAKSKNGFLVLLEILGRLYELGYNFKVDQLYPKVAFPVSKGTPMISPLIK